MPTNIDTIHIKPVVDPCLTVFSKRKNGVCGGESLSK